MKKIILILLFTGTTFAQNNWQVVKESTLIESSTKGFFIDQNTGWFGSQDGAIFHSTDGGVNWIVQRDTAADQPDINDIYFIDTNTGWACGDDATLLYTTNGGATWTQSTNVSTTENLWGINFVNTSVGYACGEGGVIIKTTNGGLNWILQITPTTQKIYRIKFFDNNNGIAIINKNVSSTLWTNSGGFVWGFASFAIGTASSKMFDCDIIRGTSHAWITGYHGNVHHSTNKGQNWSQVISLYGSSIDSPYASAIDFFDTNVGIVGGRHGEINRTIDGGVTWDTVSVGTGERIYKLIMLDSQKIIAIANYNQFRLSTDGGDTWTPIIGWPRADFRGIGLADSSNISFYTFGGDITYSNDAGNNFSFPNNENLPTTKAIESIEFYDANIGFYGVQFGQIAKTTDGGATWYKTNVAGELNTVRGFSFYDQNTMWACARHGIIYKSTDGGENWNQIADLDAPSLYTIYFLNDQIGYTAGDGCNIYKCTDGNASWTLVDSIGEVRLHAMDFIDNNTGFIVGYNGMIGKTIDGGNTWDILDTLGYDTSGTDELWDIEFVSSTEGWIGAGDFSLDNGAFYHTTDAGNTWQKYESPNGRTVRGIKFISPTYGWAAGAKGSIYKYDISSGIDNNSNALLNSFDLYSNYPNPFNPGTNIEYHLNISGKAILSIYDIQGRKIRTLAEENQKPGSYHYYWDSKNKEGKTVSSGTYFYQLEINNEIHAKRMILIK